MMVHRPKTTKVVKMQRQPNHGALQGRSHNVRAINPRPRRRPSLKRMIGLGSQVLDRLLNNPALVQDPEMHEEVLGIWNTLEVAWTSTTADRRVALTRLQNHLRDWTADDAWVADDKAVQRYRRKLHEALDH